MVSITKEMKDALEEERKKRLLDSVPETIRMILSEHITNSGSRAVKAVVKEKVARKN